MFYEVILGVIDMSGHSLLCTDPIFCLGGGLEFEASCMKLN